MQIHIRPSLSSDLDFLLEIETTCFDEAQRSSSRSIRRSLTSHVQEVFIAEITEDNKTLRAGSLTLHLYPKMIRIYSIAVLPGFQGRAVGKALIGHAYDTARQRGMEKISLEVLANNNELITWYSQSGFDIVETLHDYYGSGMDGIKMAAYLTPLQIRNSVSNIIVVDEPGQWNLDTEGAAIVSSKSYITEKEFQTTKNLRVFNLCNSYKYQSMGYYVSLLASARDHRAIPSSTTMIDFKNLSIIRSITDDIDELIQKSLAIITDNAFTLMVYFGQTTDTRFKQLGSKLYFLFEAPLLHISFIKTDKWLIRKVMPLSFKKIQSQDIGTVQEFARKYFSKKRFTRPRIKNYTYDLAILYNPNETNPPSCPDALKKFKKAADKAGFFTEFITKEDYNKIAEFDALFIRETTNVNDHTYRFSRTAYAEGLVVVDDPWSILRCSNKIYLDERMRQNKIPMPASMVLSKIMFKRSMAETFQYPVVLKQPDSAFSLGVTKIDGPDELLKRTEELFKKSELIIVQEFTPSEYDWRIGIWDQKPIFACKYFMAKNHWQIYDWKQAQNKNYGSILAVPLDDVPPPVLKTATKAAGLIGDGLYGVDLKMIDGKVYLIEVNDNPNIDAGLEDAVLKNQLYEKIMTSIFHRIELSRNMARYLSV